MSGDINSFGQLMSVWIKANISHDLDTALGAEAFLESCPKKLFGDVGRVEYVKLMRSLGFKIEDIQPATQEEIARMWIN